MQKEEKIKEFDNFHKNNIFQKNYAQKISLFSNSNQSTTSKSKSKNKNYIIKNNNINNDEMTLDQYIEKIKQKYEDNPFYFESMDKSYNENYYKFSFCLFCHNIAFAFKNKVSCINKCFIMDVNTDEFTPKYKLDYFLESHYDFYYFHMECGGDIIPIYIDDKKKDVFFICTACDNKIFLRNGIVL